MVDIIIVNWNSGEYLNKCVSSIFSNDNVLLVNKVYVIDNNSSDLSLNIISINSKIEIIHNTQNLGFSKACNQGFKKCFAEFVLLLNPDAQLLSNTLADCIANMNRDSTIDILGCSLLDDNGNVTNNCSRFPTPIRFFYDATGLSKIAPKIFTPATIMTDWDHLQSRQVDQVMGAFMFMRKSIFDKIGYFDEQFFVYFEEVDFSKRLGLANGKTHFNSSIKAIHSGEGTTSAVKAFRLFLSLRSRLQYSKKHFSYSGYLIVWFSTFFIEPITRTLFLFFKANAKEVKEVVIAYKMLIKNSSEQT